MSPSQRTKENNAAGPSKKEFGLYLDAVVAQDPEQYVAWLSTLGYGFFKECNHPSFKRWDVWCPWVAPTKYEEVVFGFTRTTVPNYINGKPRAGPGAPEKTKFGPTGVRPTVTLEQAERGWNVLRKRMDV